jgi:hypothetical protein
MFQLRNPSLAGDTLRGRSGSGDREIRIARTAIDSLWVRQGDRKAARLVGGITMALAVLFVVTATHARAVR